jgi:hypothetical protein
LKIETFWDDSLVFGGGAVAVAFEVEDEVEVASCLGDKEGFLLLLNGGIVMEETEISFVFEDPNRFEVEKAVVLSVT